VQLTKSSQDIEWCQNYLEELKSHPAADKAQITGILEELRNNHNTYFPELSYVSEALEQQFDR
jgi:hypothetical protein